jgi:hypothetical protein
MVLPGVFNQIWLVFSIELVRLALFLRGKKKRRKWTVFCFVGEYMVDFSWEILAVF